MKAPVAVRRGWDRLTGASMHTGIARLEIRAQHRFHLSISVPHPNPVEMPAVEFGALWVRMTHESWPHRRTQLQTLLTRDSTLSLHLHVLDIGFCPAIVTTASTQSRGCWFRVLLELANPSAPHSCSTPLHHSRTGQQGGQAGGLSTLFRDVPRGGHFYTFGN